MCWWIWLLPLTALWALIDAPRWLVMICVAVSLLQILKLAVFLQFNATAGCRLSTATIIGWFIGWPGLNAADYFRTCPVDRGSIKESEWLAAIVKTALGCITLTYLVPSIATCHPLFGGWVALFGLLMLFHFGAFHLLALMWCRLGRSVKPLMDRPLLATSVGGFWSHRWNLAFRDFANQFVMRPLARRWGGLAALWGCFLFSGLVHELAISIPAGGGYGLPTGYFLLQAAAATFERSAWGQRLGLRHGWRGWLFALLVIAPGAMALFHPPFIRVVVLPLVGLRVST